MFDLNKIPEFRVPKNELSESHPGRRVEDFLLILSIACIQIAIHDFVQKKNLQLLRFKTN